MCNKILSTNLGGELDADKGLVRQDPFRCFLPAPAERHFLIHNLLVRIHLII